MDGASAPISYELRLTTTASSIGYFFCRPAEDMWLNDIMTYLEEHPFDEFMHKHMLDIAGSFSEERVKGMIEKARESAPVLLALLYEAVVVHERLSGLKDLFTPEEAVRLKPYTPLITIKASLRRDQLLHYEWLKLFSENISEHKPLPAPGDAGLPMPFDAGALTASQSPPVPVVDIRDAVLSRPHPASAPLPSLEATAQVALERLAEIGVIASDEMRHIASLSPIALFRKWHLSLAVQSGRQHYTLTGLQTSYGRGLSVAVARASYAMEMAERVSSFASFGAEGVLGYKRAYPLTHASRSEFQSRGILALDPNALGLEAPYEDEPLYWMEAERRAGDKGLSILIPAQVVFLFCNLDETGLFSGLGSTGLASGNTMEQAKVSALHEVLERDAEATTLYDPARCFRVEADDPEVSALLSDYRAKGITIQFQDMTTELGVPCYKCFVISTDGQIIKGTGSHLSGKRALLSALTETTYPYPNGPASAPGPENLPTLRFEDLPDYSTGDPAVDLAILEATLAANGYEPIYVDLTRADLDIPVVKAIVPGMELIADFDRFSRVSRKLLANYLRGYARG